MLIQCNGKRSLNRKGIGALNPILQCGLSANKITLGGSDPSHFINCWSEVAGLGTPEIDMGGSGRDLSLRGYSGGIKISNLTGDNRASLDLISGQVIIDATCTAGTIVVRGADHVEDNSGSGCTVVVQDVIDEIAEAVWAEDEALRLLGLVQENQVIDQTSYNGDGHLTSARVRLFDMDPDASGASVIASYIMTSTWSGDEMQTYTMVKQ